jgi:hypothetical protein
MLDPLFLDARSIFRQNAMLEQPVSIIVLA